MSGRSAYVRKEKEKVNAYGMASASQVSLSSNNFTAQSSTKSAGSASSQRSIERRDDMAYARARKPTVPSLDVSGIDRSTTRAKMDKMSGSMRKGLSFGFGKKKKESNSDGQTPYRGSASSARSLHAMHAILVKTDVEVESYDAEPVLSPIRTEVGLAHLSKSTSAEDAPSFHSSKQKNTHRQPSPRNTLGSLPELGPPPSASLPPVPEQVPQIKKWSGLGRPVVAWNKLRKDPELWDPHGDTLVFLSHETHPAVRGPPAFQLSSQVLEMTDSWFLLDLLRDGSVEEQVVNLGTPPASPSPINSTNQNKCKPPRAHRSSLVPSPPASEISSISSLSSPQGGNRYKIFLPPPLNLPPSESLQYHITTRNFFAFLYGGSLVGTNLLQTLTDLHERLKTWLPNNDNTTLLIDYVTSRGLDDVRNDFSTALSLLSFAELKQVRWTQGWREAFVHCSGMQSCTDTDLEMSPISHVSKALLERAGLESKLRIQAVEEKLFDFDFSEMWPTITTPLGPARSSFERARMFFKNFYETSLGSWPPRAKGEGDWLTRNLMRSLQSDFGALYDYLVDRHASWEHVKSSAEQQWTIRRDGEPSFSADTTKFPLTDLLLAFDDRHSYPHIPHPCPIIPDSITTGKDALNNAGPAMDGKLVERKIALAYSEATNIYVLTDFPQNKLVDAFLKFEKLDLIGEVDPAIGRRSRWMLIYGILQTLAELSVDVPGLRYTEGVTYHLNPRMRGCPPWKRTSGGKVDESVDVKHEESYCWLAPATWIAASETDSEDAQEEIGSLPPTSETGRGRFGYAQFLTAPSVRNSTMTSTDTESLSSRASPAQSPNSVRQARRFPLHAAHQLKELREPGSRSHSIVSCSDRALPLLTRSADSGYGMGIERVDENWPIREENYVIDMGERPRAGAKSESVIVIRDFDDGVVADGIGCGV